MNAQWSSCRCTSRGRTTSLQVCFKLELTGWLFGFFSISEILRVCDSRVSTHWQANSTSLGDSMMARVLDLLDPWTHPLQEALLGSAGSLISSSRKGSVRNLWEELPGALRGSRDRVLRGSFKTFYKVKVCSKNKPTRLFKKLLKPYVHNTHFFEGPVSL